MELAPAIAGIHWKIHSNLRKDKSHIPIALEGCISSETSHFQEKGMNGREPALTVHQPRTTDLLMQIGLSWFYKQGKIRDRVTQSDGDDDGDSNNNSA